MSRKIIIFSAIFTVLFFILPAKLSATQHIGNYGCAPCHVPHNAVGTEDDKVDVPLWSGQATSSTFDLYESDTLDTSPEQPTGSSSLCLSCHDGTDPVIGEDIIFTLPDGSTISIPRPTNFGTDLRKMHPISIDYTEIASHDDFKEVDDVAPEYLRGKNDVHRVECASCHDVHDNEGSGFYLLRDGHIYQDSPNGGDLCKECHIK